MQKKVYFSLKFFNKFLFLINLYLLLTKFIAFRYHNDNFVVYVINTPFYFFMRARLYLDVKA
ncbi:hypothetical protein A3223_08320 [Campylobacter concisus]|nr:hypothetical protein A3223_08320 [Campylobacter concisus]